VSIPLPLALSLQLDDLGQVVPLAAVCALYAWRARSLAGTRNPVPGWRRACFYGGCLTMALTLNLLGNLSEELLFAHMVEHLLLGDIAALLIVLGLTGPLIAPVLRIGVFYRLRVLAHPLVAFPLWAVDLYVWHAPALYQAALEHLPVHILQHTMFVACGINMWMCLFGPLPMPAWFGNFAKLVYVVAVRLTGAALGNIFLWSGTVFYPFYLPTDALRHVSPVADQNLAGAVMMIEGSMLTIGLFCWLFLRTAREAEERQQLMDFARLHGIPVSEKRVARAVSAGRGEELRSRLESRVEVSTP